MTEYYEVAIPILSVLVAVLMPLCVMMFRDKNLFEQKVQSKLDDLCDRMARVETKGEIYHGAPHDLEDK